MKEIDPVNKLSNIVMHDGASNVKLEEKCLKSNYSKLTDMCGVEDKV